MPFTPSQGVRTPSPNSVQAMKWQMYSPFAPPGTYGPDSPVSWNMQGSSIAALAKAAGNSRQLLHQQQATHGFCQDNSSNCNNLCLQNTVLRQTSGSEGSTSSDSSAPAMSPHHPMAYSPYAMYHPMYPTDPGSPHAPPSPLMGSPVGTPTGMIEQNFTGVNVSHKAQTRLKR